MAKQIIGPQAGEDTSAVGGSADFFAEQASKIERARQHGVKVVTTCAWHDEYTGTLEALVAANIAPLEYFPGRPGGPKVSATYFAGVRLRQGAHRPKTEDYLRIVLLAGGRYSVIVGLPRAVSEKRFCEMRKADDARLIAERRERASAAATPDEFRKFTADLILMTWRSAAENTATCSYPFALESVDIERLRDVLREALAIVKCARIVPLRERAAAVSRALEDRAFQAFMVDQGFRDLKAGEEEQQ